MWCVTGSGASRLRILCDERNPDFGETTHRGVRSGPVGRAGTFGRGSGAGHECAPATPHTGPATTSRAAPRSGGPRLLRSAESVSGTGVRSAEAATRHAQVPLSWLDGGRHRMDSGHHRLQSNPTVQRSAPQLTRFPLDTPKPKPPMLVNKHPKHTRARQARPTLALLPGWNRVLTRTL